MVDVNELNSTINDFRNTVDALSEIKVISEVVQKIQLETVITNEQLRDNAIKIIDSSAEIKELSLRMVGTNESLTDSIRIYNVSVHKSVDELRLQNTNNSREIRERIDASASDIKSHLSNIQNGINNMANSIDNNFVRLGQQFEEANKQIGQQFEEANKQMKKQSNLIITCIVLSAAAVIVSLVGVLL